jgi:hypothetical protein
MSANQKRRKRLFKAKTQLANRSSGQGGDVRHNTEVNGQMNSGEAKITNRVGEHLQTKENTRIGGGG